MSPPKADGKSFMLGGSLCKQQSPWHYSAENITALCGTQEGSEGYSRKSNRCLNQHSADKCTRPRQLTAMCQHFLLGEHAPMPACYHTNQHHTSLAKDISQTSKDDTLQSQACRWLFMTPIHKGGKLIRMHSPLPTSLYTGRHCRCMAVILVGKHTHTRLTG